MTEKIKFDHQYIKCDNFKSKYVPILLSTIGGSRLGQQIKFKSYANISFDKADTHCEEPIVTYLEQFHRTKTNCLIYDVVDTEDFDTVYIYHTINARGNGGFFGYVIKNSNTGKQWHKYFIDAAEDELCRSINKTLWLLTDKAKEIYGEYI